MKLDGPINYTLALCPSCGDYRARHEQPCPPRCCECDGCTEPVVDAALGICATHRAELAARVPKPRPRIDRRPTPTPPPPGRCASGGCTRGVAPTRLGRELTLCTEHLAVVAAQRTGGPVDPTRTYRLGAGRLTRRSDSTT